MAVTLGSKVRKMISVRRKGWYRNKNGDLDVLLWRFLGEYHIGGRRPRYLNKEQFPILQGGQDAELVPVLHRDSIALV